MKRLLFTLLSLAFVLPLRGDYADIISFFNSINTTTTFPVQNQDLGSVESAFGVRHQTTTGRYDWHRGIDIDGNLDSDLVYAPIDGYFHDYRETARGGFITILYHEFADFNGGAVTSIDYDPDNNPATDNSHDRFYTWYVHLSDDGNNDGGSGSFDEYLSNYMVGDPISKGTPIGILGNTGSPGGGLTYGPHLHFEVRFGTNSSLDYQLNNAVTQYGFDPHLNPMLLFDVDTHGTTSPNTYTQSMSLQGPIANNEDIVIGYVIDNDETPLLNRMEFEIVDDSDGSIAASHVLDFNTREGFDPSDNDNLDIPLTEFPFIDPQPFGDTATQYETLLIVPTDFTEDYFGEGYSLRVTTTDLWGNDITADFALVPEPGTYAVLLGAVVTIVTVIRRRKRVV